MHSLKVVVIVLFLSGIVAATTPIKVACIGNSITAGVKSDTSYPSRLAKLLGAGYTVQNDGVSATTMLKHGNTPYWTKGKLTNVFNLKPNIITIKLGTNDTKTVNWNSYNKEFKKDYLAMIDTLNLISSKPKIYLVLPVPIFTNGMDIRDSALKKIIVIVKQIATERNLPVLDANTPLLNFSKYFTDGVHPTDPGSDTIAHVIYRGLTSTAIIMSEPLQPITEYQQKSMWVTGRYLNDAPFTFDIAGRKVFANPTTKASGRSLHTIYITEKKKN